MYVLTDTFQWNRIIYGHRIVQTKMSYRFYFQPKHYVQKKKILLVKIMLF